MKNVSRASQQEGIYRARSSVLWCVHIKHEYHCIGMLIVIVNYCYPCIFFLSKNANYFFLKMPNAEQNDELNVLFDSFLTFQRRTAWQLTFGQNHVSLQFD